MYPPGAQIIVYSPIQAENLPILPGDVDLKSMIPVSSNPW